MDEPAPDTNLQAASTHTGPLPIARLRVELIGRRAGRYHRGVQSLTQPGAMAMECTSCGGSIGRFDSHCESCGRLIDAPPIGASLGVDGPDEEEQESQSNRTPVTVGGVIKAVGQIGVVTTASIVGAAFDYDFTNWRLQENIKGGINRSR